MNKLLTREEFNKAVFERDKYECIMCGKKAIDVHHILERKLFNDGGYYLDNGVSLCEVDHIRAENSQLSCDHLRINAGITKIILPSHLDPDVDYDKWGNELVDGIIYIGEYQSAKLGNLKFGEHGSKLFKSGNSIHNIMYTKYPRTHHVPWSEKSTDDDKRLSNVNHFIGREVIGTIKMDGENTTMYPDKIHARSINSDNHPSRDWVKGLWAKTSYQIPPGWRICGENLYALHTIPYQNLDSYFNVFSIWDGARCLDWNNTVEWCNLFDLQTVPVFYRGIFDEKLIHSAFPEEYNGNKTEGYVIRLADGFYADEFDKSIAKFVSKRFVINDNKHWIQGKITPNKLKKDENGN